MLILFSGRQVEAENLPLEIRQVQVQTRTVVGGFMLPEMGLSLDDLEADLIKQALNKALGNRSKAARLLGLSRDTLLYRIKKYAIEY
jgi:DNA-binding NtrC family response regulator